MSRAAVLGNHIYFLPEGKTIDAVVVASDAKPDSTPATNWTDYKLGCVQSVSMSNDSSPISIRCPLNDVGGGVPGGVYQASDEIPSQQNMEIDFVVGEISPTVWRALWLSGEITDSGSGTGAFVPLGASGFVKGLDTPHAIRSQQSASFDRRILASLRLNGSATIEEDDALRAPLKFKLFANVLNTGVLSSFF